jgi:hypothetical protein
MLVTMKEVIFIPALIVRAKDVRCVDLPVKLKRFVFHAKE